MKIEGDVRVEIRYRMYDADGALVESSETDDGDSIRYDHGADEILPALEQGLAGAEPGETRKIELDPEDAFGSYEPEGLVSIPRNELPGDQEYRRGDWITISLASEENERTGDEDDEEMEMRIAEVHADEIILDANHPLAGQRVTFDVEVVDVAARESV